MSGPFELHFPWWFTMGAVLAFNVALLFVWLLVFQLYGWVWLALAVVGTILAACVVLLDMPPADASYELAGFAGLSAAAIFVRLRRQRRARARRAGPDGAAEPPN